MSYKGGTKINHKYDNHLKLSNFSIKFEDISSPANRIFQLNDLCRNGSKINIHQYKRKTCKLKDNFLARDRVVGIATKRFGTALYQPVLSMLIVMQKM